MRAFTALFSLATLALGVIATPSPDAEAQFELVKRQCGGGTVSCCNNIQSSTSTTSNFNRVRLPLLPSPSPTHTQPHSPQRYAEYD